MFDNITNFELDFSAHDNPDVTFHQRLAITPSKRSVILTIFNVFRSFVGMGILTLPFGVKIVGSFLGFFIVILMGIIVSLATHLLLEIANDSKFKGSNYEVLGRLVFGKGG